jgi:hypothetical protein
MPEKATLSKEYADKGWQLVHAQKALPAADSPTGAAREGHFIALKRDPNVQGDGPVEMAAQSQDELEAMIADWERSRPLDPNAEVPQPTEEQLRNSAEATLHQSITSGARPAVDVDLTPAAKKPAAAAIRLAATPEIKEVELDDQTIAGIAGPTAGAPTGKTTGVGEGTTPGTATGAGAGRKSTAKRSGSRKSATGKKNK